MVSLQKMASIIDKGYWIRNITFVLLYLTDVSDAWYYQKHNDLAIYVRLLDVNCWNVKLTSYLNVSIVRIHVEFVSKPIHCVMTIS